MLHIASRNGHVKVVEELLAHGANTNLAASDKGRTPLCVASGVGHVNIVEMLLSKGAT
jgi:ankyrin repeat protein